MSIFCAIFVMEKPCINHFLFSKSKIQKRDSTIGGVPLLLFFSFLFLCIQDMGRNKKNKTNRKKIKIILFTHVRNIFGHFYINYKNFGKPLFFFLLPRELDHDNHIKIIRFVFFEDNTVCSAIMKGGGGGQLRFLL